MSKNKIKLLCKNNLEEEEAQVIGRIKNKFNNLALDPNELTELGDHTREEMSFHTRMIENIRDIRYLAKIKSSLWRIRFGAFGDCVKCGIEIGPYRLLSRPTCLKCFDCQKNEERKKKMRMPLVSTSFQTA